MGKGRRERLRKSAIERLGKGDRYQHTDYSELLKEMQNAYNNPGGEKEE